MVLLRVRRTGSPHRGEGPTPGEGPAAALRGILCRRKGAQVQGLRRRPSRQEAARRMGEDLDAHVIRYFSTAALSQTSPLPGRCGTTAKPSTIASGSCRILSAQSTYSIKWQVGVAASRCALTSG